ncbi:DNA polymerase kappa [Synchiropus splendidus]|uniref:DNA polymerase kappa n=1 Tax=Synchiropus splendidus TaxID=270530 RepID=UPI00237E5756|nr:DNA polymerase kappa [Synchiropus splendidus]
MENSTVSEKDGGFLSRMALNDNKAGMEGLDRDRINKIIMESSKGSRFYENEMKREQQVNQRIEKMMVQKAQITEHQLKKAHHMVERMVAELDKTRDLSRVIVHVDMDAFYAAVEMRDCPELKDKPMAVGAMSMLSTSNYHARKFGVRAAMPGFIAKKLCPELVIVPTNFDKYRAVSHEIREIFADYDPHFQPMSLDEAYLDFTDHLEQRRNLPESSRTHHFNSSSLAKGDEPADVPQKSSPKAECISPVLFDDSPNDGPLLQGSEETGPAVSTVEVFGTSVEEAVREMRFRIEQKTQLTASAGIAPNMMLAKVCSDKNKPNGQYRLAPSREAVMDFIQNLPVRKVSGIGKVCEKMLNALDISSCSHLGQQMAMLSLLFSETMWHHFLRISLGLGSTHIARHEERKSMSTERTFRELSCTDEQVTLCREICQDLADDMKKEELKGKTVTLKLKNVNFEVRSRAVTLTYAVSTADEIFAVAKDLLKTEIENEKPQLLRLRLMGVRISTFVSGDDKKAQQKSIIGFLQSGKPSSAGTSKDVQQKSEEEQAVNPSTQTLQTKEEIPRWTRKKSFDGASDETRQSFFQKAQAKRLQLQTANGSSQEDHDERDAAAAVLTLESEESEKDGTSLVRCRSPPPPEPQASTSGLGASTASSYTCPVCFSQVKTSNLSAFNAHIDRCLSNKSCEPVPYMISDSESEADFQDGQLKCDQMDKCRPKEVQKQPEETSDQNVAPLMNDDSGALTLQKPQSHHGGRPALICPVCQLTQNTDDLTVFNSHVDLCLNQQVLHELQTPATVRPVSNPRAADKALPAARQASKGKTKRRDISSSAPAKKAKVVASSNTIDKFFR